MFYATLKIVDAHSQEINKEYKGEGETIFDAISNIPQTWADIKTKGTIEVSQGKKKAEKHFELFLLRKIFANKLIRAGQSKNFQTLLK